MSWRAPRRLTLRCEIFLQRSIEPWSVSIFGLPRCDKNSRRGRSRSHHQVKHPAQVHKRDRIQRAATQRMSPGHPYRARQRPAKMYRVSPVW